MRVASAVVFGVLGSFTSPSYSQQDLIGTYKGEYWERGAYIHPHIQNVVLRISSADGGRVAGKLELGEDLCRGTYDFQGTYQNGQLSLRTSEGSTIGCAQQVALTSQGNKLTGNMSAESPGRPGIELLKVSNSP